jgi:biopolymer transport protein TolR
MAEINVVPYIDVTLVLLIIFMITAPLVQQGVEVDLPQAEAKELPQDQEPPLVVTVDAGGLYYMDVGEETTAPVELETIAVRVAAVLRHKPKTSVLINGDSAVDYGKVVTVMAVLKAAGVPNVGLMTQSPETGQ